MLFNRQECGGYLWLYSSISLMELSAAMEIFSKTSTVSAVPTSHMLIANMRNVGDAIKDAFVLSYFNSHMWLVAIILDS